MQQVSDSLPLQAVPLENLRLEFKHRFGSAPSLASWAPGRVNLIGEHTDYNGGFVLPAAIPLGTLLLATPRTDGTLHVHSHNLNCSASIGLSFLQRDEKNPWLDYVTGVALEVQRLGYSTQGADVLVYSNVPLGSGLSSSAAFEMATLGLFEAMGDFRLGVPDAALLGQRVENSFLGLSSGVMDQFAVRGAKEKNALFLDCRSLNFELVPVNFSDSVLVVADTASPRRLTGSEYNQRVAECTDAVRVLQKVTHNTGTLLRNYSLDELQTAKPLLSELTFRRARHVISENARTISACEALRAGESADFGRYMNASHESLRDDFEVSSVQLEELTQSLRNQPGCYGARLTGAGFGGCAIALFQEHGVDEQVASAMEAYRTRSGCGGSAFRFTPACGAAFSLLSS